MLPTHSSARVFLSTGGIVSLLFFSLFAVPLLALLLWSQSQNAAEHLNYPLYKILRFTLTQSVLSTGLSLFFGLGIAWSIVHCQSGLRKVAMLSLLLPLVMPVITICLSWNFLLGTQGLAGYFGIKRPYGLSAILSVHVFLNMTLIAWLVLPAWRKAPEGYWRIAQMLNLTGWQLWRQLEWPLVKPYAYRSVALCFLFCFTSFTPVFLLGGSPKYTTFETAIYTAMRVNFDPVYALILGISQFLICTVIIVMILKNSPKQSFDMGRGVIFSNKLIATNWMATILSTVIILICAAPLVTILIQASNTVMSLVEGHLSETGIETLASIPKALQTTMMTIISAMLTCLCLGWVLAAFKLKLTRQGYQKVALTQEMLGGVVYALPALIMGAGWLAVISLTGLWKSSVIIYLAFVSLTTLIGVPVVIRSIVPAYEQLQKQYGKLAEQLGLFGWQKIRKVDWPQLKVILLLSAAYAGVMASGDLGAFILISNEQLQTLPILIQRQMAGYHHQIASLSALTLILTHMVWLLAVYFFSGAWRQQ